MSDFLPGCHCRRCQMARIAQPNVFPKEVAAIFVCPRCSDRKCPHAGDHMAPCLGGHSQGGSESTMTGAI